MCSEYYLYITIYYSLSLQIHPRGRSTTLVLVTPEPVEGGQCISDPYHFRPRVWATASCSYGVYFVAAPHLISGPMTECLRSMALALALVRSEAGSPLMAKMASPTPSLPSWLTEPPWSTLRTSMPEPSLIALTDIPANTHTHVHRWVEGWLSLLWTPARQTDQAVQTNTWQWHNQHNQDRH